LTKDKWHYNRINNMISDYLNINNEELKDYVYDYIQEVIWKSNDHLTQNEFFDFMNKL